MHAISLPMYDLPFLRKATDSWLAGLVRALTAAGFDEVQSVRMDADGDAGLWRSGDLLLSQTCGYPLITQYADILQLVLVPKYRAAGCTGANYTSTVIVRDDAAVGALADLRGMRCAVNNWHSHSGMNALRHAVAPLARNGRFFGAVDVSGSHLQSIARVAAGASDVAAIDCVTFGLTERHAPELLSGVRVLTVTPAAPALPYVTRASAPPETMARLRAGLHDAASDPDLVAARDALLLRSFTELPLDAYDGMAVMAAEAMASGYDERRL